MESASIRSALLAFCALASSVGPAVAAAADRSGGQIVAWGGIETGGVGLPPAPSLLRFAQIACGESHALALSRDGSVVAWGSNWFGQRQVPVGLGAVRAVACGARFSVALKADQTVVCWGEDTEFWQIPPLGDVVQIVGYEREVLVRTAEGTVSGFPMGAPLTFVPKGLPPVEKIAGCWNHAVALTVEGSVACWGDDVFGQCQVPPSLGAVRDVSAGDTASFALLADGSIVSWGYSPWGTGQAQGAIAIASGRFTNLALMPSGEIVTWGYFNGPGGAPNSGAVAIAGGEKFGAALLNDGSVELWGENFEGQCDPPPRLGLVRAIAPAFEHAAAIREDGSLVEWGRDIVNGGVALPESAVEFSSISAGFRHMGGILADGSVVCWGNSQWGEAVVPPGLPPIAQVECGLAHTLARGFDGSVHAWGLQYYGQCAVPKDLIGAIDVSAGDLYSLALRSDGIVVGWGFSQGGAANPPWMPSVTDVAAGLDHGVALLEDGSVRAWGLWNAPPPDPGPFAAIATNCFAMHSVALRTDGVVVAWGYNDYGQCDVPEGLTGVVSIAANRMGTFAVIDAARSACGGGPDQGTATLVRNAGAWNDLRSWTWSGCGPQVPGASHVVDLGPFGVVGATCDAQAGELQLHPGSTLLVPIDFHAGAEAAVIEVAGEAHVAGRVWLLGEGLSQLPADLDIPFLRCASALGGFDVVKSSVPAPPGRFLTVVATQDGDTTTYRLRTASLADASSVSGTQSGSFVGRVTAFDSIDANGDGRDDLAAIIDLGPSVPGVLQFLLNDGEGGFGAESMVRSIAPEPRTMAIGDVDSDGLNDVVVGCATMSEFRCYLRTPAGGLTDGPVVPTQSIPESLAVLARGKGAKRLPAIAVGMRESKSGATTGRIAIHAGPDLAGVDEIAVPCVPTGLRAASPLLFACGAVASGGMLVRLADDASGQIEIQQSVELPGTPVDLDARDIDGDGSIEIVTANVDPIPAGAGVPLPVLTLVRESNGALGGAIPLRPDGSSEGMSVALVDVDGDSDLDIVSVHRVGASESRASIIRVDLEAAGGPFTLDVETALDVTGPSAVVRGNLDDMLGEDFVVLGGVGSGSNDGAATPRAHPYLGGGLVEPPCREDIDGNGAVDGGDLATLLSAWGGSGEADLDQSGTVDAGDLAALLSAWGACP